GVRDDTTEGSSSNEPRGTMGKTARDIRFVQFLGDGNFRIIGMRMKERGEDVDTSRRCSGQGGTTEKAPEAASLRALLHCRAESCSAVHALGLVDRVGRSTR